MFGWRRNVVFRRNHNPETHEVYFVLINKQSLRKMLAEYKHAILAVSILSVLVSSVLLIFILRLASILARPPPQPVRADSNSAKCPLHLLIVLGSGGHTAEMLNILGSVDDLDTKFVRRTYLVSSGDGFSASKAVEFEKDLQSDANSYTVVTVRRARRVHQSFLSTPYTTLLSLWDCLAVLRGTHGNSHKSFSIPNLILTNGPGTGVCVVLASICLLFVRPSSDRGQMRTIYIESWARVKTLSLSGKILKNVVNRFLVQWPQLATEGAEYIGPLVS